MERKDLNYTVEQKKILTDEKSTRNRANRMIGFLMDNITKVVNDLKGLLTSEIENNHLMAKDISNVENKIILDNSSWKTKSEEYLFEEATFMFFNRRVNSGEVTLEVEGKASYPVLKEAHLPLEAGDLKIDTMYMVKLCSMASGCSMPTYHWHLIEVEGGKTKLPNNQLISIDDIEPESVSQNGSNDQNDWGYIVTKSDSSFGNLNGEVKFKNGSTLTQVVPSRTTLGDNPLLQSFFKIVHLDDQGNGIGASEITCGYESDIDFVTLTAGTESIHLYYKEDSNQTDWTSDNELSWNSLLSKWQEN